jgi:hypothetical protein
MTRAETASSDGGFVKEKDMPPNRMVALLTPVIAVAAGAGATWLAEAGLDVSATELQAVFVAALAAVLAPAAQWLHGSQRYERHQSELEQLALVADTQAAAQAGEAQINAAGSYEDEDDDADDDGYYDDGYADDGGDDADYDEAAREPQPAPA